MNKICLILTILATALVAGTLGFFAGTNSAGTHESCAGTEIRGNEKVSEIEGFSTVDMLESAAKIRDEAEAKLKSLVERKLETLREHPEDAERLAAFERAQAAWEQFRKTEVAYAGAFDGSFAPVAALSREIDLIRARIRDLDLPEGDMLR